ncbi:MAG: helix-turn-helix domain-containing protein [Burkholderiales bacterium]|jgi:IS30 family transposase|nr:helix-turn-helix domain-containing protein [Burkholderiales bacterium]
MGRTKHITKEERFTIQVGLESGRKISAIAKELNRSKSCIFKEIFIISSKSITLALANNKCP